MEFQALKANRQTTRKKYYFFSMIPWSLFGTFHIAE